MHSHLLFDRVGGDTAFSLLCCGIILLSFIMLHQLLLAFNLTSIDYNPARSVLDCAGEGLSESRELFGEEWYGALVSQAYTTKENFLFGAF